MFCLQKKKKNVLTKRKKKSLKDNTSSNSFGGREVSEHPISWNVTTECKVKVCLRLALDSSGTGLEPNVRGGAPIGRQRKKRKVIVGIVQSVRSGNFGSNFVLDEFRAPISLEPCSGAGAVGERVCPGLFGRREGRKGESQHFSHFPPFPPLERVGVRSLPCSFGCTAWF